MTTKHTPGPWTATAKDHGEWDIDAGEWAIALVAGSAGDGPGNAESDANARLIAAAPELLDVAKAIAVLAEHWGDQGPLVRAARSAIAKAEGRS